MLECSAVYLRAFYAWFSMGKVPGASGSRVLTIFDDFHFFALFGLAAAATRPGLKSHSPFPCL